MSNKKHNTHAPWVWIDLEMTGLNARQDRILEIACIVTDPQLNVVATLENITIACPSEMLENMEPYVRNLHTNSGLLERVRGSNISIEQAEEEVLAFIKAYAFAGESILCGNSIWQDKYFLLEHMPSILSYLHYRILDVSSFKIALNSWYPKDSRLPFVKKNTHRALEDIQESIAELQYYRQFML